MRYNNSKKKYDKREQLNVYIDAHDMVESECDRQRRRRRYDIIFIYQSPSLIAVVKCEFYFSFFISSLKVKFITLSIHTHTH